VKPQWQQGASQPIKLRKLGAAAAAPAAKAAAVKLWGGALDVDDDELVDDEELLTEEDMQRPSVPGAPCCYVTGWPAQPSGSHARSIERVQQSSVSRLVALNSCMTER